MIDPDIPKPIHFQPGDQPELPDILQAEIEAAHLEEQRRKQDNLRWMEKHAGFRPFGVEW